MQVVILWGGVQLLPLFCSLFEAAAESLLWNATLVVLVLLGLTLMNVIIGDEAPETYAANDTRRKHLDFLRAKSKQFPPPFPNGWYCAAETVQVLQGVSMVVHMCGVQITLTRSSSTGQVSARLQSATQAERDLIVSERLGLVLVWIDAEERLPFYELTMLDELENEAKYRHVAITEWSEFLMHVMVDISPEARYTVTGG